MRRYFHTFFLPALVMFAAKVVEGLICEPLKCTMVVQLFEWNWKDIARECHLLGQAGMDCVHVSPAIEHIQGSQWWTPYQVVSYKFNSRYGNKEEFEDMVKDCRAAGVNVMADAVINHMSALESGVGVAGTPFKHYNYPDYDEECFHLPHCGLFDYGDQKQVQECELDGLADLNTSKEYVRNKLRAHLREYMKMGISCFRVDAAKHISKEDLEAILKPIYEEHKFQCTLEVPKTEDDAIGPTEYHDFGSIQEFRYSIDVKNAFKHHISSLCTTKNPQPDWVPRDKAQIFVATPDTERVQNPQKATLKYYSPYNAYLLAHIWMMGQDYGVATLMSSYDYHDEDQGRPEESPCTPRSRWRCEHRTLEMREMTRFRKVVGDIEANYFVTSPDRIHLCRGNKGCVIINNCDTLWRAEIHTTLEEGSYYNVLDRGGDPIHVGKDGIAKISLGPWSAAVIHIKAMKSEHNFIRTEPHHGLDSHRHQRKGLTDGLF